jgi:phage portal protein BeeE
MTLIADWYRQRKASKNFSNTSPIEKWGNSFFYPIGSANNLFNSKTFDAFNRVPEVNAVLNYRANAKKNVIITAVNKTNGSPAQSPNASKALRLLNNPNYFQAQKEFIRQTSLWHDIEGNEYMFFLRPVGFKASSTKALFTLPPQLVNITLQNEDPFFWILPADVNINYSIRLSNKIIPLETENIVHLNDNRVNVKQDQGNILKGESKLIALSAPINNIIAAYEARNVFLTRRGALGILSNSSKDGMGGTVPLEADEKDRLQAEFQRYGVQANQWHTIITNMSLEWQQMGVDIDKLKVFEEVREDFFKILDAYGVPQDLFASNKGVTFQNQKNAEKRMYESTIIPEFSEWIGGINKFFGTENESWELRGDFTHIPVFSENVKERSASLQTLVNALSKALADGAITIEQYKNELQKFNI